MKSKVQVSTFTKGARALLPALALLISLAPRLPVSAASTGDWQVGVKSADGPLSPYWVTLANGQVLGKSAGVPAAITPLVSGDLTPYLTSATAASTYEPILTAGTTGQYYRGDKSWQTLNAAAVGLGNVSNALQLVAANNLSDLANVATARSNLGLSSGDDVTFGTFAAAAATIGEINTGVLRITDGAFTGSILASLTASRNWAVPDHDGDFVLTGDTGTVTSTMLAGSIALSKLSITGTPNGTKYLRDDGTWQTISTGLTIGSTAISGGTSGRLLTSGATVGELTLGSGVSTWLGTPTMANLDAAVSDGNVAYTNVTPTFSTGLNVGPGGSYAAVGSFGFLMGGSLSFLWASSTILETAADGSLKMSNYARTGFGRLQFGGYTSSFPALKRSSTKLIVRLADDSANAPFETGELTVGSTGSAITTIKRASVTLVAGTATVSDTATTANTVVLMSVLTPGGTVGTLDYDVSAGSSYTINSSSATDTSVVNITVIHFP